MLFRWLQLKIIIRINAIICLHDVFIGQKHILFIIWIKFTLDWINLSNEFVQKIKKLYWTLSIISFMPIVNNILQTSFTMHFNTMTIWYFKNMKTRIFLKYLRSPKIFDFFTTELWYCENTITSWFWNYFYHNLPFFFNVGLAWPDMVSNV